MIRCPVVESGAFALLSNRATFITPIKLVKRLPKTSWRTGNFRCLHISLPRQRDDQRVPLSGYYADILGGIPRVAGKPVPVTNVNSKPTASDSINADAIEERAGIIFGTRLAGPGRTESKVAEERIVAGVRIPPKPVEPDNCCMSGCVNCVWDLYRDDMEEYVAAKALAKAKLAEQGQSEPGTVDTIPPVLTGDPIPTISATPASSSATQSEAEEMEDFLKNVPVGMREFMRMEKAMKQRRAQEARSSG